jgi:hypothetical protein
MGVRLPVKVCDAVFSASLPAEYAGGFQATDHFALAVLILQFARFDQVGVLIVNIFRAE